MIEQGLRVGRPALVTQLFPRPEKYLLSRTFDTAPPKADLAGVRVHIVSTAVASAGATNPGNGAFTPIFTGFSRGNAN
jgi:hypothetical protein